MCDSMSTSAQLLQSALYTVSKNYNLVYVIHPKFCCWFIIMVPIQHCIGVVDDSWWTGGSFGDAILQAQFGVNPTLIKEKYTTPLENLWLPFAIYAIYYTYG